MGKSQREKGARVEREIVHLLSAFEAKRVPLSGAAKGFKGDVLIWLRGKWKRLEVKARQGVSKLIERWLEGNDYLVTKSDRKEPLVHMTMTSFIELLESKEHRETQDFLGGDLEFQGPYAPDTGYEDVGKEVLNKEEVSEEEE